MSTVPELFGSLVFNETVMKERLPKDTFRALMKTRKEGQPLVPDVANVVANAMKDWAVENGCTHFTHWFQPMTGITAEKHDSFIYPVDGEKVIMEFSGKELIKGEPDASSFPSGGLRATFEARGYTAWDPTSDAFIKDNTLCIPTAFCSYTGEALDKKTPLLRSMNAINKQALRILRLFGDTTTQRVNTNVGPEQEYFLIDRDMYCKRRDLVYTGRTLFGAKPPKGQEMEDHYFGVLKPRVKAFMDDLDNELWKLGILAKTEHNEVAPSQHELAPIYTDTNVAADHNQLTMEIMKKVAARHNLACLLHEKPFEGVNGSGKHNNWSLSTDGGSNLLDPGDSPRENAQFLLFLVSVIQAVDEHQDLLRLSVASAGNDHRLGANEAPPAIISIFLGDELTTVLDSIDQNKPYAQKDKEVLEIGVDELPPLPKDTTDRNRTSPFAFTGNKFEFRMLGSTVSIACPNMMLNTIVADVLEQYADRLEKAKDFNKELNHIIREAYHDHKHIVFNGDGYTDEWIAEAKKRGLLNLSSTAEALPYYTRPENVALFEHHSVLTKNEVYSRCEIQMENYTKQIHIEAETMVDMIYKDILPAANRYVSALSNTVNAKATACSDASSTFEKDTIQTLSKLSDSLYAETRALEKNVAGEGKGNIQEQASYSRDTLFMQMEKTRRIADQIEPLVAKEYWPYPTYGEMLFSVV
ncbi:MULTISPECIES: glutamine synthetase III [Caproicibacterium]|uniref:Glutamine synthetase type III n=1 Tax=Caproicibacterium lactatifermentans TaxID=2666138 RepID=A0A859DQ47_9FIRM|nr:glutamine synthetase III [Caproicibacterium lactatifermentans]ARP50617.1 glutamine synthetase type III [Ruminococcaceae bacterium CPB6]MDD4807270.1 glutamine synthetase III [Oscillospiraceae bacterium]QKN23649.1 glutamine synthetase type III [Caproicibacterium lactatifermentans]QKO29678.1 glutamine synthetase type III [Caproicibacterium lactatifermentans]